MTPKCLSKRRGFTLIELLVVVAIIALLIAILLPSLAKAKEQAKTTKCVANLKGIGTAMAAYFTEQKEWFPFEKRNWPQSPTGAPSGMVLSAFYYGGHPGYPGNPPGSNPPFDDAKWRCTFREKPFNPYMYDNLHDILEQPSEKNNADFMERRKAMEIFRCPSDTGGFFVNQSQAEANLPPIFDTQGSSYDINYHFVWLWAALSDPQWAPNKPYKPPGVSGPELTAMKTKYLQRANQFLKHQRGHNVSRFIILYEDPFDSSQWQKLPRIGWHKNWNRHSFLFLDSHAANIYTDVTKGNFGPGWKTSSLMWFNDVDDPDYPLRDLAGK